MLLSDGSGDTLWVVLPRIQHRLHVIRCVLPNLEACGLLQLVGLTQSSHDCVHIPCVPHGSDLLHELNHFLKEQIGHGAEIEPLHLSQAGLSTMILLSTPSLSQ